MNAIFQRTVYSEHLTNTFNTKTTGIIMKNDDMPALTMINAFATTKEATLIEPRNQYIKYLTKNNNIQHSKTNAIREIESVLFSETDGKSELYKAQIHDCGRTHTRYKQDNNGKKGLSKGFVSVERERHC